MKKHKRKCFRQILSFLVAIAMLTGNLPVSNLPVYATESEMEQELSAVSDNEEATISENAERTISENEGEEISEPEENIQPSEEENTQPSLDPEGDILSLPTQEDERSLVEENNNYPMNLEEYQGNIFQMQSGGKGLSLLEAEALEAGSSFDDAAIAALLKQLEAKEEKFEVIEIIYNSKNPEKITQELWNQMTGMLEGEEQVIFLGGKDPQGKVNQQWIFIQPKSAEAEINLKAVVTTKALGEGITFNLENTEFPADRSDFLFMAQSSDSQGYESFCSALGEEESYQITDSEGINTFFSDAMIERWEREGENYCRVRLCGIRNIPANNSFTIKTTPYVGSVWIDRENGRNNLDIIPTAVGKTAYSYEELIDLMGHYSQKQFDEIYLEYPIENHELKKMEIELLAGYLSENQENGDKLIKIGFYEENQETGETGVVEEWRIINPERGNILTENQQVSFEISIENNVISGRVRKPEVQAERVEVWYITDKDSTEAEKLRETFGEENHELHFLNDGGQSVGEGRFQTTDDSSRDVIELYDISGITTNESFTLQKKYGWEYTENWGQGDRQHLSFSSMDIGKNTFDKGDLEKYLAYYVKSGKKFDSIYIEQRNISGQNDIKKDEINFLRTLLKENNHEERTEIVFTFCSCEYGEETGHITSDINWILTNPKEAEADIDANISLRQIIGSGMGIKFNKAPYHGEDLAVQIRVNEKTDLAGTILESLGEAPDTPDHEPVIVVMEKSTVLHPDFHRNYWTEKEGEGEDVPTITCLHFGNLKDYEAGKEYLLAPLTIRGSGDKAEERFYLGDNEHNQRILQTEADLLPGKVSWYSYTPETLVITKSIPEAVNLGEAYYSASYTVGKNTYLKVFRNQVEVELQDWMPQTREIELELYREGGDVKGEQRYLQIFFYPTFANMDQRDLTWEIIQGEDVIELIKEEVEYYDENGQMTIVEKENGEILAKTSGEAIIKITLPENIPFEKQNKEGFSEDGRSVLCTVRVWNPMEIPEEAWPQECIAVTNFDTTLKEVEINQASEAGGTFEWMYPETSLSDYYDLRGHSFPAVFFPADGSGRRIETSLYVRFVSLRGIGIGLYRQIEVEGEIQEEFRFQPGDRGMLDGDEIVLGYLYKVFNGNSEYFLKYQDRLQVSWSTKPEGIGTIEQVDDQLRFRYTAKQQDAGIKQVTVTLTNKDTGKIIGKDTINLTVMSKAAAGLWNFFEEDGGPRQENVLWDVTHRPQQGEIGEKGTLILRLPKEEYYKLTLKALDPKVWKLGKVTVDESSEPGYVLTKAEYEIKGYGNCRLSITAADEIKSKAVLHARSIISNEVEVSTRILKINKKLIQREAGINLYPVPGTKIKADQVLLEGGNSGDFKIQVVSEEGGEIRNPFRVQIQLMNQELKKGNYQLQLKVPVYTDGGEEEQLLTSQIELKVTLTEEVPKVTIKQESKVNTFYQGEPGYGRLSVDTNYPISSIALRDQAENAMDYGIIQKGENYYLYPYDINNATGKKVELWVYFEDYEEPVIKKLTIATEHKAPTLELERSKINFYPAMGATEAYLTIRDKKTKEPLEMDQYTVMNGKTVLAQLPVDQPGSVENIQLKNSYAISAEHQGVVVTLLSGQKATDKLTFLVKQDSWADAVKVSAGFTTITTEPKLVTDNKKLLLNTHKDLFRNQVASTAVRLEGSSFPTENIEVFFTGRDAKSREILNNSIRLEFWYHSGEIVAKFNELNADNLPKDGTYKFRITARFYEYNKQLSSDFTLTLKSKAPEKCVTITKKGSIDILDRSQGIMITPKVAGISGKPVNGELEGKDRDLFYTEWDGTALWVYPNAWAEFSTKISYQVTPTFEMEDEKQGRYRVFAKTEKIKVKQGKASVSIQSEGNLLFDDRNSSVELDVTALLNKKIPLEIREIILTNYTEDFWIEYHKNDRDTIEGSVMLYRGGANQVVQKGKKWNLKFEVILKDQAGNSKNLKVTYPVVVN